MKSYYVFYKETIKLYDGDIFEDFRGKIISAKTEKAAINKLIAETEGSIVIDQIYETTGDARI